MITMMRHVPVGKISLAAVTVFLLLLSACGYVTGFRPGTPEEQTAHLTILHTNDIHGHLDNMPRLATAIEQAREEAGQDNTLLLDAGDIFSGSIYFKLYQGQASLWFFNYLGYEVACPGNHDFDGGLETLTDFVSGADFRVVSVNLGLPSGSTLHQTITPWAIIEKDGERYGVFGLLTEETSEILRPGVDITVTDPTAAARQAVAGLEEAGIDKIIALTHLGWNADLELARDVGDIDVIVGGHSHTVPENYPTVVNDDGSPTLVVQAGEYAEELGHLDVSFDNAGVITDWTGSGLVPLDSNIADDPIAAAKLAGYRAPVEKTMNTIVGRTLVDLDGERSDVRSEETNLGDIVADSMLSKAGLTGADIAIISGGGIRDSIPAGDVTLGQVMSVLPFDDYLVTFDLTGGQIISALENGVSRVEELEGRFPQVAGLRFVWAPSAAPGSRVISVEVEKDGEYRPIDPTATYRIVTNSYLQQGGDGYTVFTDGTNFINLGYTDYETLADYITENSPVDRQNEGRISRK
jgi:2',3'-cyclic-nucleotide 2'-phosphodiesterase (5'-nucleotidase family)